MRKITDSSTTFSNGMKVQSSWCFFIIVVSAEYALQRTPNMDPSSRYLCDELSDD